MKDSGLEEVIQVIYPGNTEHVMSGMAYYKALRAHFLDDTLNSLAVMDIESQNMKKLLKNDKKM